MPSAMSHRAEEILANNIAWLDSLAAVVCEDEVPSLRPAFLLCLFMAGWVQLVENRG